MTKSKLIGIKCIQGTKDGRAWSLKIACLSSEMTSRDAERGASGSDVHSPAIPERYADLLCEKNIGKEFDVEYYYVKGREQIAYASLVK